MAAPTPATATGGSRMAHLAAFVGKNARFYAINVTVIALLSAGYSLIASGPMAGLDEAYRVAATNQIVSALFYSCLVLVYPIFLERPTTMRDPNRFIVGAFVVKVVITLALDFSGIFPGVYNFGVDYEYSKDYLFGQVLDQPGHELGFYYPPGCSLFFVFLYIINPARSALAFRMQMLAFDLGTSWMIWRIARIKSLRLDLDAGKMALVFYTFSAIQMFMLLLYQKFDTIVIFLSLAGIYYMFEKKWFRSALFLVFCGFFKVYAFLWLGGILLFLLKTRQWRSFKAVLVAVLGAGLVQVAIFYSIEGLTFFQNLFAFGWHFTVWEEGYNLNWSYYLKYLNLPFLNYLPPALIIGVYSYYVIFHVKQIDFKFFINSILILLLLYPSVNYHYVIWIVPLIGLDISANITHYRKGLLAYDVVHVSVDQHAFAWLLVLGYGPFMVVKTYAGLGTLVVLVVRLVVVATMLAGMLLLVNLRAGGNPGRVEFDDSRRGTNG